MAKNNPDVHSFDEVMDAMLGAPGTPQREQFRREARRIIGDTCE